MPNSSSGSVPSQIDVSFQVTHEGFTLTFPPPPLPVLPPLPVGHPPPPAGAFGGPIRIPLDAQRRYIIDQNTLDWLAYAYIDFVDRVPGHKLPIEQTEPVSVFVTPVPTAGYTSLIGGVKATNTFSIKLQ